jgi:mannobiose 2-epimerase
MTGDAIRRLRLELEQELKGNILPWWMSVAPDRELGGFHGHITHQNHAVRGAGKGAVLHARVLWTFSAASRMYGLPEYLETARLAYDYILKHFLDDTCGGVYWELDPDGRVRSSRKQIYALAFTLYALVEYHLASGEDRPLQLAIGLYTDTEAHAFDRQHNGYTEALSREWGELEDLRLSEKDENVSKTMNTHLHILEAYANLCRVWKDPDLERSLENLIGLFLERFVDRERSRLNLFFNREWALKSSLVSFGHDIECSWLLHEAAGILGRPELEAETGSLSVSMAEATLTGLAGDGGLFYEFNPETHVLDTDRHWWPQAEAMVGYFNAYQISGREVFLDRALGIWNFIREHLIDREHGEWHWSVDASGKPQTTREKAGFWKCPYHNGRACMELIRRIDQMNLIQS